MRVVHRSSSGLVRKHNHARFPYIIERPCLPCAGILRGCAEKGGLRKANSLKGNGGRGDRKVFSEMETEMRELRAIFGY